MVDRRRAPPPAGPTVPPARGHYESWLPARSRSDTAPRGVWIRYTVTVRARGRPSGQLWFTWFDRGRARTRVPSAIDVGAAGQRRAFWIRFGEQPFGPAEDRGGGARRRSARRAGRCTHRRTRRRCGTCPGAGCTRARLPRTKLSPPSPTAVFDGDVEVDGETIDVSRLARDGRAQLGRAARRAVDLAVRTRGSRAPAPTPGSTWRCGRVRLGPVTTPWVANGALSLDGRGAGRLLGGLGRRAGVTAAEDAVRPAAPRARASTVTASVSAPRRRVRRRGTTPNRDGSTAPGAQLLGRRPVRSRAVATGHAPARHVGRAAARRHAPPTSSARRSATRSYLAAMLPRLCQAMSASLVRRCSTALVCSWQMRLSVTPRTRPMSARVRPSK